MPLGKCFDCRSIRSWHHAIKFSEQHATSIFGVSWGNNVGYKSKIIRCHSPENHNLNFHGHENLKSRIVCYIIMFFLAGKSSSSFAFRGLVHPKISIFTWRRRERALLFHERPVCEQVKLWMRFPGSIDTAIGAVNRSAVKSPILYPFEPNKFYSTPLIPNIHWHRYIA
jgi:hypothetical protein